MDSKRFYFLVCVLLVLVGFVGAKLLKVEVDSLIKLTSFLANISTLVALVIAWLAYKRWWKRHLAEKLHQTVGELLLEQLRALMEARSYGLELMSAIKSSCHGDASELASLGDDLTRRRKAYKAKVTNTVILSRHIEDFHNIKIWEHLFIARSNDLMETLERTLDKALDEASDKEKLMEEAKQAWIKVVDLDYDYEITASDLYRRFDQKV